MCVVGGGQSMCALDSVLARRGVGVTTVSWVPSCLGSVASAQSCDLILDSLGKELQCE